NYGSMEFLGPHVDTVGTVSLGLSAVAFGWLLLWRLRASRPGAPRFAAHTAADAAFVAVLMFTVTSRVISPQYLVWLVGLGAVCRCFRASRMRVPVTLVLAATPLTLLEFPLLFADVVASTPLGITLLFVRNDLLVTAALLGAHALWRGPVRRGTPAPPDDPGPLGRAAAPADTPAGTP
ncbi:hypothetical protein ACKI1J_46840, partial [Streptomyces scabiei]